MLTLARMTILALCLLSHLRFGAAFQISRSNSVTLRNKQEIVMQISDGPSRNLIDTSINKQLVLISVATVAVSLVPGVAEAADGSMAVAKVIGPILDAFIFAMNFLFVCRTVISWYPKTDLTVLPFSAIVWPTEPLLVPVRELVPPAFGVDVSAIVWISLLSFLHEILTGQQGILTLLEKT